MRFQLLAARLALAALVLAAATAAAAVIGVRLGLFPYKSGLTLMVPAVALGVMLALICALAWLFSALKRNQGERQAHRPGRIDGRFAALLWPPLHILSVRKLHHGAGQRRHPAIRRNPPHFVVLAGKRAARHEFTRSSTTRPTRHIPGRDRHRRVISCMNSIATWLTQPPRPAAD